MVVASGTLQRMREEGFTHAVTHVVEEPLAGDLRHLHAGEFPWAHAQESRGDEHLGVERINLVARDLLAHELIIAFVCIERTHDVIAIAPGIATLVIVRET